MFVEERARLRVTVLWRACVEARYSSAVEKPRGRMALEKRQVEDEEGPNGRKADETGKAGEPLNNTGTKSQRTDGRR